MAFFKSLFRKKSPGPPTLRSGMQAEVLDPSGSRIFRGSLRVLEDGLLEVRTEEGDPPHPPPTYNQEVRLRISQESGGAFTLNGTALAGGLRVWRIEKQKPAPSAPNLRDAFRQNAGIEGRLHTPTGQVIPCKVLDVSAGGVQITASKLFQLDAVLHLEVILLSDEPPFSLHCRVRRIRVLSNKGSFSKKYQYGCQFLDVPLREQERLLRVIFTLERNTCRHREKTL